MGPWHSGRKEHPQVALGEAKKDFQPTTWPYPPRSNENLKSIHLKSIHLKSSLEMQSGRHPKSEIFTRPETSRRRLLHFKSRCITSKLWKALKGSEGLWPAAREDISGLAGLVRIGRRRAPKVISLCLESKDWEKPLERRRTRRSCPSECLQDLSTQRLLKKDGIRYGIRYLKTFKDT